jgi:predicted dithiol-disulfide oxidoreductase (DUF899 family)
MTEHKVGTREEWLRAREELLKGEKELTHRSDELARQRRELPWVPVDKEYRFETEDGTKTLAELFDGRSQLLVYHFMFGPEYTAGCPVCSSGADTFNGAVPHLNARDVTFLCISRAPLETLQDYRRRMGWTFPWVSSEGSDFNFDFDASHTEEQLAPFLKGDIPPAVAQMAAACGTDPAGFVAEGPALSAFALSDGVVYQTYATSARGLEIMMGFYPLLDRVAKGRDEEGATEFWIRRHDEYEAARPGGTG